MDDSNRSSGFGSLLGTLAARLLAWEEGTQEAGAVMGIQEILGYICLAGAAVSFVTMYLIPKIRRQREASQVVTGNRLKKASQVW